MPLSRRSLLKGLTAAVVGAGAGSAAYGYAYERHRIGITRATLPVSGLSPAHAGLRIGFITDIHRSEIVPHDDVVEAVGLVLGERPDVIVLGGDYVTWGDRRYVGPCAEALGALTAPHGVFATLGNHDDDTHVPAALKARGFAVLKDQRTRLEIRGEPIEIAGIRFWTRRVADIVRVLHGRTATLIMLAHDPRRVREAADLDVPLVLSGHTHGGQVVLPVLGAVAARRFPIADGTMRRHNTTMFVSRGIGTIVLPCRLNCPPEVAILTLERQSGI